MITWTAVTVRWSDAPVDDLRRMVSVGEARDQSLHQSVLVPTSKRENDTHACDVVDALEPRTALALKLLQHRPAVLDARRGLEIEILANDGDRPVEHGAIRDEQLSQSREI
jgi:hypothetical protein